LERWGTRTLPGDAHPPQPRTVDSVIEDAVLAIAASPWVYVALFAFATIDGFFPPVPSESAVIALAALWAATGDPALPWVVVAAMAGAFAGDQIAYTIGHHVDVGRLRLFRGPRGVQLMAATTSMLGDRGAAVILAARYVPIGRVAVNVCAGSLAYPRGRFVALAALAAVTWTATGVLIGAGAGRWLGHNPLWAVAVGVAVGAGFGLVIDGVLRRRRPLGEGA